MSDADKILEEVNALNAECARLRDEFKTCAVRLADEVVRKRDEAGDIEAMFGEQIRAYIEADRRYTKAVNEASEACERLTKFLYGSR